MPQLAGAAVCQQRIPVDHGSRSRCAELADASTASVLTSTSTSSTTLLPPPTMAQTAPGLAVAASDPLYGRFKGTRSQTRNRNSSQPPSMMQQQQQMAAAEAPPAGLLQQQQQQQWAWATALQQQQQQHVLLLGSCQGLAFPAPTAASAAGGWVPMGLCSAPPPVCTMERQAQPMAPAWQQQQQQVPQVYMQVQPGLAWQGCISQPLPAPCMQIQQRTSLDSTACTSHVSREDYSSCCCSPQLGSQRHLLSAAVGEEEGLLGCEEDLSPMACDALVTISEEALAVAPFGSLATTSGHTSGIAALSSGSKDSTATWHLIPANTAYIDGTQVAQAISAGPAAAQTRAAVPVHKRQQQPSQEQQQQQRGAALLACASSRQRLRGAEVSLYTDATSPEALAAANGQLGIYLLPGGLCYLPVPEHSVMWRMGVLWQFPAYAVALGSSYFQRLLVALPHLAAAVRCVPSLRSYWDQLVELGAAGQQTQKDAYGRLLPPSSSEPAASVLPGDLAFQERTLHSIQFTCMYIATKVADQVHATRLLPAMLQAVAGRSCVVTPAQAAEVEIKCLEGLGWRLGPHFVEHAW